MATFQSVQSATVLDSGTLVITKPTSLAVGDWLVAAIYADVNDGSTVSLTTPVGWTLQENWGRGSDDSKFALYYKVADSADVAASNFTFSATGSTGNTHMLGHLARITNAAFSAGSTASADDSTGTSITAPTFTPTRVNCLLIGVFGSSHTSIPTHSAFSIATSNPTWTERASSTVNDSVTDSRLTFYTATRPESTAIGTVTGTQSVSNFGVVSVFAIAPQINGSITQETKLNAYAISPIPKTELDAIVEDPTTTVTTYTPWSNPDKPSTTWNNPDK